MKYILITLFLGISALFVINSCTKDDMSVQAALTVVPCDSLKPVIWADTLKVVPGTISYTIIKRGQPYAGDTCWQAMLSSDGRIAPTNFQNNPKSHRVVIGDLNRIQYGDIFYVSRIK